MWHWPRRPLIQNTCLNSQLFHGQWVKSRVKSALQMFSSSDQTLDSYRFSYTSTAGRLDHQPLTRSAVALCYSVTRNPSCSRARFMCAGLDSHNFNNCNPSVTSELLEKMQLAQHIHSPIFPQMLNVFKLLLSLSATSWKPVDCNLLGTFSCSLVEPTHQLEDVPSKATSRNDDEHQPLTPRCYFSHFKILKFLYCTTGWSREARGRPCSPFASAPKSRRPMWMGGLVQGAAHILHKLVHLCVAKWCHLPESLFIIEVLKAYSVATAIHQHIKEALAPCEAANSLFPHWENRNSEGLSDFLSGCGLHRRHVAVRLSGCVQFREELLIPSWHLPHVCVWKPDSFVHFDSLSHDPASMCTIKA